MSRKLTAVVLGTMLACFSLLSFQANQPVEAAVAASSGKAKNVIFMIPDGFSTAFATNYRLFKGQPSVMDSLLVGMVKDILRRFRVNRFRRCGNRYVYGA
ncbi:hypothetical protein M3650_00870 [Paenibacillus sp. MER TA 81-3]|uniref:hypothetical protein n=1 Tax=Paenibacillus sp. MER TA 81-3 TaxID=2939573 RepID=UPI00203B43B2|nr:hypothetical protein [Paenibacillus sp. MER TA 81-3]MCM3337232.1 hypothetical protein [Paenibacillus sp. MER TA 81-3]